ncbi:S24 family peptidase [Castellaniella sp.]|uniref:S24 family peptidase n=1 Tax=Castellaniella sp. TaxID=1955812 RepID=UPI002AFF33BB|nr:S24 family peptidase [Castellaniella sp.]
MNFQARITAAFQEENRRLKEVGGPHLTKTHLWQAAKVTSAAVTFWFNGANAADLDTCMKIAPLMRVRGQWLFDGTGPKHDVADNEGNDDHASIRLVDAKASAGKGQIILSDDVTKILMFRRDWLAKNDAKPDQTIGFEVDGDSMTDMHIIDGSVVLANRRRTDPLSKRVYVVWIKGKLYVKELVKKDGVWWARSHNTEKAGEYPDIQIDDPKARIAGRAFWCGFGL